MKALLLTEYLHLEYTDFPDPEIGENEVLVRVKACGICGSDVHGWDGSSGRRQPPLIMGHEAAGIIEEAGKGVRKWKAGDRVTFDSTVYPLDDWFTRQGHYNLSDNREVLGVSTGEYRRHGAFAEFVAIPEHILYKIPDNVSFEHAAMTEPVAVAHHAVNLAGSVKGKSVIVVGAGMIGLFVIHLLKIYGAGPIIAVDLEKDKQNPARESGADIFLQARNPNMMHQILELTQGRGADISFEAVGISETVSSCISATRKGGRIVLIGNVTPEINFPVQQVVLRELSVQGSCAINGEYTAVLELFSRGEISVERMISARVPLSQGAEMFERLYNKEKGLRKVLLIP